ncbi:MAG TPA: hypothetical protein VGC91_13650 [Pyrinomonadaceae bacterium]
MGVKNLEANPHVLLALPQFPHDPSSGAARTATTICEMLAAAGFAVHALATTASEGDELLDVRRVLADGGIDVHLTTEGGGATVLRYAHREIEHTLLDINDSELSNWQETYSSQYDLLFEEELARFRPQILLTYGGQKGDVRRQRRARSLGCHVVFALFNLGYFSSGFFDQVDSVLTPSEFLSTRYREKLDLHSTSLPTPLHLEDVFVPERRPLHVTMINPSIGKGVMFVARLAEELGIHFPEIPFEVIQSRGSNRLLVQAGFVAGFDLRRHRSLIMRPSTWLPRDLYTQTRMLLVPSVAEEASARVVAEALVNGIPVIASERGGLPENCAGSGFIIPLPSQLTLQTRRPVDAAAVQSWVDIIVALYRDEKLYECACAQARESGKRYLPETVAQQYVEFFRQAQKW